ncbi:Uncharacterised protein [Cedecea lapagei]|uniref:Uncharacterized protein n=1 Tax=Cedecea lapagei TaxID=158823 RepID=A0A447V8N6_9ENTR|nr:Uncharacterised protein [Cedecea lapagei]
MPCGYWVLSIAIFHCVHPWVRAFLGCYTFMPAFYPYRNLTVSILIV